MFLAEPRYHLIIVRWNFMHWTKSVHVFLSSIRTNEVNYSFNVMSFRLKTHFTSNYPFFQMIRASVGISII